MKHYIGKTDCILLDEQDVPVARYAGDVWSRINPDSTLGPQVGIGPNPDIRWSMVGWADLTACQWKVIELLGGLPMVTIAWKDRAFEGMNGGWYAFGWVRF